MDDSTRRGVYEADRASALAGVPLSTLYLWARRGLAVPSISAERVKLWSWTDLVAARAVYWLRHPTSQDRIPTPMARVQSMLGKVHELSLTLGESLTDRTVLLLVDVGGVPYLSVDGVLLEGRHRFNQRVAGEMILDLLATFSPKEGVVGPDLRHPRPHLAIVPGKLAGEPHIEGSRIETRVLYALHRRGYSTSDIRGFYPEASTGAIESAISLEKALSLNLKRLAA